MRKGTGFRVRTWLSPKRPGAEVAERVGTSAEPCDMGPPSADALPSASRLQCRTEFWASDKLTHMELQLQGSTKKACSAGLRDDEPLPSTSCQWVNGAATKEHVTPALPTWLGVCRFRQQLQDLFGVNLVR